MKIYCSCCDKVQPVRIDNCRDAKTNEPFQDIVCAECDLVIASGTDIVTPAQQQEPVGHGGRPMTLRECMEAEEPAGKPWVGLTKDERMDIINRLAGQDWVYAVDAIEAKLREKNA